MMKMRQLTFEQIADSRFNEDENTLLERNSRLKSIFYQEKNIIFLYGPIRKITFENEKVTQYRIRYLITKIGRKPTWNAVYKMVNSVKAVPYHFV